MTDQETIRRYEITSAYMNNQEPGAWRNLTRRVFDEARLIVDDEIERDALGVLRASYWHDVRTFAEEIAREQWEAFSDDERLRMVADDAITDEYRERMDQAVHETADGSEWVIYTWRSYLVPLLSDHADAFEESIGSPSGDSVDMLMSQVAFMAMREDLLEATERIAGELIDAERMTEDAGNG